MRNGEIEEPLEDMPFPIGFMGLGFTTWWFFTNPFEKYANYIKLDSMNPHGSE